MSRYKIIAIDETGKASLNHPSTTFILSGLIVSEDYLPKIDRSFKKLKTKFFNDSEIVFHCRDMLRKKGPFALLRDPDIEKRFWPEFMSNLNPADISTALVVVDKDKAKKLGWNEIAILRRAYSKILEEFTKKYLSENKMGKIVVESDPSQDKYLLEAHNRLQGFGIPSEGIRGSDYRNKLTSISLVNKFNLDSHIQMADNLAMMGQIFYELKINKRKNLNFVEAMFQRLIDRKIAAKTNPAIFEILV